MISLSLPFPSFLPVHLSPTDQRQRRQSFTLNSLSFLPSPSLPFPDIHHETSHPHITAHCIPRIGISTTPGTDAHARTRFIFAFATDTTEAAVGAS